MQVEDKDMGYDKFFDTVDGLMMSDVLVGYPTQSGGFGVPELAAVHEFGVKIKVTEKMRGYLGSQGLHLKKSTKEITIPSRPFIRSTFDNNKDDIGDYGVSLVDRYLEGKVDLETLLNAWGDFVKDQIRNGVVARELELEPNHPFTIERKGSDTPLVNTGEMLNRIEVVIE